MREIKFRFWKANTKEMLGLNEALTFLVNVSDLISGKYDNFNPLQYTGLKDRNGVEIYEGDIVRFVDFDTTGGRRDDREHTGVIKFQSGLYEIWGSNESEYYGNDGAFILNHTWLQDDEFEVIGNIYKNPELLAGDSK